MQEQPSGFPRFLYDTRSLFCGYSFWRESFWEVDASRGQKTCLELPASCVWSCRANSDGRLLLAPRQNIPISMGIRWPPRALIAQGRRVFISQEENAS